MFQANILPGQGFKPLLIYRKTGQVTASGRAVEGRYHRTGKEILGAIVNASQTEIDQWKQNGHPITHKIIQYSGVPVAEATDYLSEPFGADYYVKGRKTPAQLGVANIYYVEERSDLDKELD